MAFLRDMIRRFLSDVGTKNQDVRDEWVKKVIASLVPGSRILDAGSGQQRYRDYCKHLVYVSQDFCEYDGTGNEKGLQSTGWNTNNIDIVSDIVSIPVGGCSFDAILCTEVFEHIPAPLAAIREFNRILKPGGSLIVTAPFCSLTHMAPYHYYSGFNRYFFEHHLPLMNFEIVEIVPNGNYVEFLAQELRRLPSLFPKLPLRIHLLFRLLLPYLGKASRYGIKTDDLLCFGFHVRAVKKSD